jgi:uncharacterized protein YgiB involved in biofilm formation
MRRRASARITLVLIGAAALGACGDAPDEGARVKDTYLSLDECAADWGRPEYCERQDVSTAAGTSTYYHGPIYYPANRAAAQVEAREEARRQGLPLSAETPGNRAIGRSTLSPATGTARGGFGRSARLFSGGS